MKQARFVHLHTHSQYSLLDGACRIDSVVNLAKEYKMPALAITDHGNMFGAVEFFQKATKAGVKPILGCESYVAAGSRFDKKPSTLYPDGGFHLLLLVKNEIGYRNLIKLCSAAYLEGFYHRPRIDKELLRKHSQGLIATTACLGGEVNWLLLKGDVEGAVAAAQEYRDIFGDGNFYLEIQNHGLEKQAMILPKVEAISRETGIPMVVTNDCHYLHREDAEAHDALLCIQTGKFVTDTDRMRYETDQIYFKSADEMHALFPDHRQALENSVKIADQCNFEMELGELKLPVFPLPVEFDDADAYLRHICEDSLKCRYDTISDEIRERLDYELGVIKKMGYAGYFLITKDFCDYARSQKIPVGPGRGSAAGSIVSYLTGITNIDPIRFNLLFERFLNPERVSMPDIDIDFADRGRDQIIHYVIEKYGKDNVCQIITFGTMAARAVVRDVGRVLGIPYGEVDKIAKMVPAEPDMTIAKALEQVSELSDLVQEDPRVAKLIKFAQTLEGLARHCSTHAAGVVIAPSALTDYVPLFKGSKDEITTQYDMKRVEQIGMLKMDFLGLRTLTVIDDTVRMIRANHSDCKVDMDNIELEDPEVYKIFARGDTIGVFQFESGGMQDYLRKLEPENFTDITAMNALYRPGPLDSGMIDKYIKRKREGSEGKFAHPILKDILAETYGIIVFQEHVLKIANLLAGYSLGKADLLRKAMGKKDARLMAAQKREFLKGTDAKGIDRSVSEDIFHQIETFARYGFNRAHSTCYAYIAYQTAWLKCHYPREFLAALMTSEINDSDRIYKFLEEARKKGIAVLPPDINGSMLDFSVVDGNICFGLQAVRNVGEGPARAIAEERTKNGPYKSLSDLVSRIPPGTMNRRTLESLVAAGACDALEGSRARNFAAVEAMLEYGRRVFENEVTHDLFAGAGGVVERTPPPLPDLPDWSNAHKLEKEKEMLGFYISGHPLDKYRGELECFTTMKAAQVGESSDGHEVTVGGMITSVKRMIDKKGNMMAFATVEDFTGALETIIFSKTYDQVKDRVQTDRMVLVTGKVSTREGKAANILVNDIVPLEDLAERFNCQLVIKIDGDCSDATTDRALTLLEAYSGPAPVLLAARENGNEVYIRSKKYSVRIDFELLNRLKELLGDTGAYLRPLNAKSNFH